MNQTKTEMCEIDLSNYHEPKPRRALQILWRVINATLFKMLVGSPLRDMRNLLLRAFGAKICWGSIVYPSCKIWAPWLLEIGKNSCVGPHVQLYNKAQITLGDNVVVSQGSFLCTASHDISDPRHSLVVAPILLDDGVWVAADSFIGMGVHIGKGAVVGARGCVFRDVEAWTVVGGNPARFIKKRVLRG